MSRTTALALILALAPLARAGDDGFQPLTRGDDPAQFTLVGIGPETITIKDGEIRLTGKPNGYFATKEAYRNYVLRFEWKYDRPEALKDDAAFRGNSGVLLHIRGHKVWPESIEVQLFHPDAGHAFAVGPAAFQGQADPAAQHKAARAVGEWNAGEVVSKDGTVVVRVNGVEVSRGHGARPDRGPIGWQSEGAPIRFRNLTLKETD